jgi:hypothetical protein
MYIALLYKVLDPSNFKENLDDIAHKAAIK